MMMEAVLWEDQYASVEALPFSRPLELCLTFLFVTMTMGTLLEFSGGGYRCQTPCHVQESWRTKNYPSHNTKGTLLGNTSRGRKDWSWEGKSGDDRNHPNNS